MVATAVDCVALFVLAASLLVPPSTASGSVRLFNPKYDEDLDISFGPAQRCHSFPCRSRWWTSMTWEGVQEESKIAFYETSDCDGKAWAGRGPDGELSLDDTDLEDVASVMLWESGRYETRGLKDVCTDDMWAERVEFNHSLGSGSM